MEYVKGNPFFCDNVERIKQYPYLDKDIQTDILIIGGGIDGAIANYFLSQNHQVTLVDKAKLGFGCTSCATALLEYQLDEFANDLSKFLTEEEIVAVYKMGLSSIAKIQKFIKKHSNKCNFKLRPTFLYTDSIFSQGKIEKEYNFRKSNGFNCELYDKTTNPFPFSIKKGIFCKNGGCEFSPYLFCKQLIENSINQNNIFENTKIDYFLKTDNCFIATTNYGYTITCNKIIIATGFNWEVLNKSDLCERFTSFSIVTQPIKNFKYYKSALIHNSENPYHYLRTLPDNRIIFGGEDVLWNEKKGISTKLAKKKYEKLEKDLKQLFPNYSKDIVVSHKFCGAFGTTSNNLGLIGESKEKNIYYFISCGANGIINAIFGVELLEDLFKNKHNNLAKAFSPTRES